MTRKSVKNSSVIQRKKLDLAASVTARKGPARWKVDPLELVMDFMRAHRESLPLDTHRAPWLGCGDSSRGGTARPNQPGSTFTG